MRIVSVWKGFLLVAGLLSCGLQVSASSGGYDQAIEHYDGGNYQEAVEIFSALVEELDMEGAPYGSLARSAVLYNLGNAYYKQGSYANSLAAYLEARVYAPYDRDIQANIDWLLQKVGFPKDMAIPLVDTPRFLSAIPYMSVGVWLWVIAALSLLLLLSLTFLERLVSKAFANVCIATVMGVLFFAVFVSVRTGNHFYAYGVVMVADAQLLSTPGESRVIVGELPEYALVRVASSNMVDQQRYLEVSSLALDKSHSGLAQVGWVRAVDIAYYRVLND